MAASLSHPHNHFCTSHCCNHSDGACTWHTEWVQTESPCSSSLIRIYHQFKCLIKSLCLPKTQTIWSRVRSDLNFTWDMNYLERNVGATGVSDWWWRCRPSGLRPGGISLSPLNIFSPRVAVEQHFRLRSLSLSRLDWTRTTTNKIAHPDCNVQLWRSAEILVNYHFTVLSLVKFRTPHH